MLPLKQLVAFDHWLHVKDYNTNNENNDIISFLTDCHEITYVNTLTFNWKIQAIINLSTNCNYKTNTGMPQQHKYITYRFLQLSVLAYSKEIWA